MKIDNILPNHAILSKREDSFALREAKILERIKKHYSNRLQRDVEDAEAHEIAGNLLSFAQAIYGE